MNKQHRQEQILRLIRSGPLFTQEELAEELRRVGVTATQVTLSRDIRELGIVKTTEGYKEMLREARASHFASVALEFVHQVRCAQNQVVLKTSSGNASSVAVALDREEWPEVVGTIAGDDTVLVIAQDHETATRVAGQIQRLISRG